MAGAPGEQAAIVKAVMLSVRGFVDDDRAYRDAMAWFRRSRAQLEQRRDGSSIFGGDAPFLIKEWVELLASEDDPFSPISARGGGCRAETGRGNPALGYDTR